MYFVPAARSQFTRNIGIFVVVLKRNKIIEKRTKITNSVDFVCYKQKIKQV